MIVFSPFLLLLQDFIHGGYAKPLVKKFKFMNIHFFASVLHLIQLYSTQMCVPEPPNMYMKTIMIEEGVSKYASNNVSFLLLIQFMCLTDNYLCLISNLVASGFNF